MDDTTARDEMFARVKEIVDAMDSSIRPLMTWEDVSGTGPSDLSPWVNTFMQSFSGSQSSLTGPESKKRWTTEGLLVMQVRTKVGEGSQLSDLISSTIRSGFRGHSTPGGAWFRNPRKQLIGAEGGWNRVDVLVDFLYDTYE